MANNWYNINNVAELDTPTLVVYPDRVKHNIALVKTFITDVQRLRPHVKTHKSSEVSKLMLQAGITRFKCATISEAEMLGMCDAPDVLLAYQPVGPKLKRFIRLITAYKDTSYSCVVDNVATAQTIATAALNADITIPVYIDLNIGMNRTGIIPADALLLYEECMAMDGIKLLGLHAYDGHIHDSDYVTRQIKSDNAMAPVIKLVAAIQANGHAKPVVIAGGSPTYPILAVRNDVECSPGTFVYWDRGYQLAFPEQEFQTAALIVTRVISLPDETKLCLDVGHKSVSAENELNKRIYFLNAPKLKFISQSEEHLVIDAGGDHQFKVGDILYGLPYHICPTIALYERAITIENEDVTGEWLNIARDRKITI
ncbi:D-TA family PLP-dependent enzyme [Inquilinus sp. KBS0705]|nr:D-TA family PLP-dependent enzyme [Inquilinus sp. KBS0705]